MEYQFNKAALELLFMPWEFPESHRQRADKDGRALASRRAGTPNGEDKLREPHQGSGWLCRCQGQTGQAKSATPGSKGQKNFRTRLIPFNS